MAFPRGRRFFSSLDLTAHPSDPLLRFYRTAGWSRRGHRLSPQPVYQLALPLRVGASLAPMFSDSIVRIGLSAGRRLLSSFGRLSKLSFLVYPVILGSFGLPMKAGFLPGVALLPSLQP